MRQIDVQAVRADTPGCTEVAHLNNCGTAMPPQPVVDAVVDYVRLEARVGGYEAAEVEAERLGRVYESGARLLGCGPDELAFTTGASEAWWRAFLSVPLEAGDRVLIGRTEYVANTFALIQARERGIEVDVVPNDGTGQIDLDALAAMLDERVKLVALTSIVMTNGLVNPTPEVGALVEEAGAYFLVDACQEVGQRPVHVDDFRCDFLSFTGRKFVRGPRGSGMLYVRRSVMDDLRDPVFIDGRSAEWSSEGGYTLADDATRFEFFEFPYASKIGLGVAFNYALDLGLDAIEARITALADRLRAGLDRVAGARCLDTGVTRCGIVTFDVEGMAAMDAHLQLRDRGFNLGAPGLAGSRLDLGSRSVEAVVRAGVHYYNTEDEIDRLLEAIDDLVG